ncbi:MAG: hypothetical protein H6719_36665 [Sandaracinaceae bacterium]|nr:hypothetical protein [Sandaracinaceae bacterium]
MRSFIRRGVALAALVVATGCQVYDASLVDAGVDGGGPIDGGECNNRVAPARPTTADGPDGEEILFGLRRVILAQDEGGLWEGIGLDLDGHCTREPDYATECRPPRRTRPPVDGDDGIDNVFGAELFPLVDLAVMGLETTARAAQEEGKLPVVRIRGWNGMDNDPSVDVAITNAIYMVPEVAGAPHPHTVNAAFEPVDMGVRVPPPVWDGTDYGYFRETTFLDGNPDQPTIRDDSAYVVNRYVVARLPERVEILFPAQEVGVLVRLTDATAIGRISEDGSTLEEATVSGRWSILDLLSTAENVGICRDSDSYDILSGQLDTIADVRSRAGSGGAGALCDAISLGVVFTGSRLQWGGLTPGPEVRNVCTEVPDGGGASLDGGI